MERSDELGLSEAGLDVSGEDVLEDEIEFTQSTDRSLSLSPCRGYEPALLPPWL